MTYEQEAGGPEIFGTQEETNEHRQTETDRQTDRQIGRETEQLQNHSATQGEGLSVTSRRLMTLTDLCCPL